MTREVSGSKMQDIRQAASFIDTKLQYRQVIEMNDRPGYD
jgi:hypothetical protein